MPANDSLTFSYGDYSFDPRPLISISKEYIKTDAGSGLGTEYTIQLNGDIITTGVDVYGINSTFSGIENIIDAFSNDFRCFVLQCAGSDPIISGYPRITSPLEITPLGDNLMQRAQYSVSLSMPTLVGTGYDPVGPPTGGDVACNVDSQDLRSYGLKSISETFTIEFLDERVGGTIDLISESMPSVFSVQKTISAQGDILANCTDCSQQAANYIHPWERARIFCVDNVGFTSEISGIEGLIVTDGDAYNNFRVVNVDKHQGSCEVNETFVVCTGSPAYEDIEINVESSLESPRTTVTVNGTVQGLSQITYDTGLAVTTGSNKIDNADNYFQTISGSIFSRAQSVYNNVEKSTLNPNGSLNNQTLSSSLGYSTQAGTITYNYVYDDRPIYCVSNAVKETISIKETEPNDIFSNLTILGKVAGPLLQAINTKSARSRSISINAILPIYTGCDGSGFVAPSDYDSLVSGYESYLQSSYSQVFVTSDEKDWEVRDGIFAYNKSWTVNNC